MAGDSVDTGVWRTGLPCWFSNCTMGTREGTPAHSTMNKKMLVFGQAWSYVLKSIKWQVHFLFFLFYTKDLPSSSSMIASSINSYFEVWRLQLVPQRAPCWDGLSRISAQRAADFKAKCRKLLAPNWLSKGAKQSRADSCFGRWE